MSLVIDMFLVPVMGGFVLGNALGNAFLYALAVRLDHRDLSRRERAYIVAVVLCCAAWVSHFVILPLLHVVLL